MGRQGSPHCGSGLCLSPAEKQGFQHSWGWRGGSVVENFYCEGRSVVRETAWLFWLLGSSDPK